MKRGRKGQFYLLAAIIIIVLIIATVAIVNYSKKKKDIRVYDLSEELEIESSKVLDYGAVNEDYRWDKFTKNFSVYAGREIEVVYIIGNK